MAPTSSSSSRDEEAGAGSYFGFGPLVSNTHTFWSMMRQYLGNQSLYLFGWYQRRKLEQDTKDCGRVQEELLMSRLRANQGTMYGRDHNFSEINSREQFVESHQLTRYPHYQRYISLVAEGEDSIMTSEPVIQLSVSSSAPSGHSTLLPTTSAIPRSYFQQGVAPLYHSLCSAYPRCRGSLQKSLGLWFTPEWSATPAGIPVAPGSCTSRPPQLLTIYTTPPAVHRILSEPTALYLHLLFAIKDRMLGEIEANFASLIYSSFIYLTHHWRQMVADVEAGTLTGAPGYLDLDADIREELQMEISADRRRAEELRRAFAGGSDCRGLARRVWPHLHLVVTVTTGSYQLYARELTEGFLADVPIYSPMYSASEGLIGINLWPGAHPVEYLLIPRAQFCEFIPIDEADDEQPDTLFMDQVACGEVYELVISNPSGLYRYRLGDVVTVTRLHNTTPVIRFLYRQGDILNVHGEKTCSSVLYQSLVGASEQWKHDGGGSGSASQDEGGRNIRLVNYTSAESVLLNTNNQDNGEDAPHYHVFLELHNGTSLHPTAMKLTDEQAQLVDAHLRRLYLVYDSYRSKCSIGPVTVHCCQVGTFNRFQDHLLATHPATRRQPSLTSLSSSSSSSALPTSGSSHVKVPPVLRKREHFAFFMQNVLQ